MMSWDQRRATEISRAQAALGARKDDARALRDLVVSWIASTRDLALSRSELAMHPATIDLAGAFRKAGLDEVAEFLSSPAEGGGPIRQGRWLFAILLGRGCAADLASALTAGGWSAPPFMGQEQFGACDAFRAELLN